MTSIVPGRWRRSMRAAPLVLIPIAAVFLAGCDASQAKQTRIELTTFDDDGNAQRHFADFTVACYRQSGSNRVEIVLRAEQPSRIDPRQTITQIVHIREFWNPRPGVTYADSSQRNVRIQYAVLTPPTGVRYDGAGFVTYRIDRGTGELTGRIEAANLRPAYRMGDAVAPFGPALITGTIRARHDPGRVVRAIPLLNAPFQSPIVTDTASSQ